jgi:Ca2+-binding RTX toxin-like protein
VLNGGGQEDRSDERRRGRDIMIGGAANDVLNGDDGDDFVDGGAGNDILVRQGPRHADGRRGRRCA